MALVQDLHCCIGQKIIRNNFKWLVEELQPSKVIEHLEKLQILPEAQIESYSNELVSRSDRNRSMLLELMNYPNGAKCLILALAKDDSDSSLSVACRAMWDEYQRLQEEAKVSSEDDWTQMYDPLIRRSLSRASGSLSASSSYSAFSDESALEDMEYTLENLEFVQPAFGSGDEGDLESNDEESETAEALEKVISRLKSEQVTACMPLPNRYYDNESRRRVNKVFAEGSAMINNGLHFKFKLFRHDLQRAFPRDHNLHFMLMYLQASSLLWQNDFEACELWVKRAIKYSHKTSRPSRSLVEILSSRCWMYFQENRLQKLHLTCKDAIQLIESDPQGCTGLPAGWIYVDLARFWSALLTFSDACRFLRIRDEAIQSYEEALVHFQQDDSSDKIFGLLFSSIMLANVLLGCGDQLQTIHFRPTHEDIIKARNLILTVQDGEYAIPLVLQVQLKISLCDHQIRLGSMHLRKALKYAEEALKEATELNMKDQVMFAELRIKFLNMEHHQADFRSKKRNYFSHLPITDASSSMNGNLQVVSSERNNRQEKQECVNRKFMWNFLVFSCAVVFVGILLNVLLSYKPVWPLLNKVPTHYVILLKHLQFSRNS
ncbi:hypothetical protein CAPTEDRAFT_201593 [Capitella teleta]|uniref:CARD domain-containing protein n=1 Tax=Capitella teleta TaxID=283909 RepID=R7V233_CAPTE|nr:hypothetical protein CAPTEDRAFT_201593 [Capitella teleta]|eukprot:ELU12547.1 hypothetical protein CAPTEDRAFT_201593 [Capitella teleta]